VLQESPPLQLILLPQVPPQLFGVPVGTGVPVGVSVGVSVGVGVAVGVAVAQTQLASLVQIEFLQWPLEQARPEGQSAPVVQVSLH
jgi:hypothetical protein